MNITPPPIEVEHGKVIYERLAIFAAPGSITSGWTRVDETGAPAEEMLSGFELCTKPDAAFAVYRIGSLPRDEYERLQELVAIAEGVPHVDAPLESRIENLRSKLGASEELGLQRLEIIEAQERKIEAIIAQAREWKTYARRREAELEQAREDLERFARNDRALTRTIADRDEKLEVARRAVDRAVNREQQGLEKLDAARAAKARAEEQLLTARAEWGIEHAELEARVSEVQANALRVITTVCDALGAGVPDLVDAEILEPNIDVRLCFDPSDVPTVEISNANSPDKRLRVDVDGSTVYLDPESFATSDIGGIDGETSHYLDDDGIPVIQVDTRGSGRIRINLNDAAVWDGNPETDNAPGSYLTPETMGILGEQQAVIAQHAATISRQLDTIRELEAKRAEAAATISQISAERAGAWRDLEGFRERSRSWELIFNHPALRQFTDADGVAIEQVMDGITKLTERWEESETMRKRLDERLASERRVYETASAALRAMIRERDAVLDLAERGLSPIAHATNKAAAIGEFRAARDRLPKLETEADARDGGLVEVIRRYDGLAQIGANLARAVRESAPVHQGMILTEPIRLAEMYEREHKKLTR